MSALGWIGVAVVIALVIGTARNWGRPERGRWQR